MSIELSILFLVRRIGETLGERFPPFLLKSYFFFSFCRKKEFLFGGTRWFPHVGDERIFAGLCCSYARKSLSFSSFFFFLVSKCSGQKRVGMIIPKGGIPFVSFLSYLSSSSFLFSFFSLFSFLFSPFSFLLSPFSSAPKKC